MNQPTFSDSIVKETPLIVNIRDTIVNDTLIVYLGDDNTPIKYSRNIITGVCIDGKCRIVKINLFWNITGRYLGFELPKGEYLSKTEHVEFNSQEYDRLHSLLNDNLSALANYDLKELVPEIDSSKNRIDAVSSATIEAVMDYIVEGAVYTTYTLWHIVHGPTKWEIEKQTSEKLTSEMVLKILNSNNLNDQVWVLNHIPLEMEFSDKLQTRLFEIISGDDIYLTERSLNAIKPNVLNDENQIKLISIFSNTGYFQKRLILQKLKELSTLNIDVAENLSTELTNLNGTLIKITLELFTIHNINDEGILKQIAKLLKNKNRFIANQAYNYLNSVESSSKSINKEIKKYER